ncbi:MAG: FMN-binding glutamate synthase family protein [Flavobacteriales bacterium]|nr:FMN-binding glutamate synthase family protein [Flavobacteriales bacterium]
MRNLFIGISTILVIGLGSAGHFVHQAFWWILVGFSPLIIMGFFDILQTKHTIRKNYPLLGRLRYFFESIRPEISQYFIESDLNGRPFNRRDRSVVYQRAKGVRQTVPFGTQLHTDEPGYEWVTHSLYTSHIEEDDLRITIGSSQCKQPYNSSIMNVSAMSFGSLSMNAVLSLNGGAKRGNFAHNTGEGGISDYHKQPEGDLIWQIGTGYFGCRNEDGTFSPDLFQKNAATPTVKMIEIKLSQGAKPGHGGILPAKKNTPEIAKIRHVKAGTAVLSPPRHSAFNDSKGLLNFVNQLRELSAGKPVGFKLCLGRKEEFEEICETIKSTGIYPDFITIDGSEGGTGAAPLEFSDRIGTPLYDALAFVYNTMVNYGIKDEIKLIASGRVMTGFDIVKLLALGADGVNSARAMMFALGCIQALECDSGHCPTGIATQEKSLMKGLDVTDKTVRVANFHKNTIFAVKEILEATGKHGTDDVRRDLIYRRVEENKVMRFDEIYPY